MKEDKTLLKIAGTISIVIGVFYCITIIGLIVGIPLIIGGDRLKDISQSNRPDSKQDTETILIWTIIFFFINQISFVFSLVYYLKSSDYKYYDSSKNDKYDRLEKLKKLYDSKVLTKEEYEREKDRILNNY